MDYSKYMSVLTKVALFRDMEETGLSHMLNCFNSVIKTYDKDETIAIEGATFNGIGVLLKGQVMVSKTSPDGERVVIAKFGKSRIFGEMVAFSKQSRWPATVSAMAYTEVIFINPKLLVNTCSQSCYSHHQLILNMLSIVSDKALMLNKKLAYLSIRSMRGKLAMYLFDKHQPKDKYFDIDLNRNELADFLNVSRPSMSRELGRMKEEHIIDFHKNSFKVLDMEALKKAATL